MQNWTYDTLKRCRKFYQAYANASIVATPLPQLESHSEVADSKAVANWSNAVAPIQLPRFILSCTFSDVGLLLEITISFMGNIYYGEN